MQRARSGVNGQQWRITDLGHGIHTIANRATGLALDGGGPVASGSPLKVGPLDSSTYRRWTFTVR